MVVPTMLGRILDVVEEDGEGLPSMRSLAYGGGPMPRPVVERAMALLGDVDLVNAYGLTETSSTIAVLGPDDHRTAFASDDEAVRARLGSVGSGPARGRAVDPRRRWASRCPTGRSARSGCGASRCRASTSAGAAPSRTAGSTPATPAGSTPTGFLFVQGRLDDVIVRGGENLSPGEIEAVLLDHPRCSRPPWSASPTSSGASGSWPRSCSGPATRSTEDELRAHVQGALRSARTPERIRVQDELPFNETGKLLRRVLRDELTAEFTP